MSIIHGLSTNSVMFVSILIELLHDVHVHVHLHFTLKGYLCTCRYCISISLLIVAYACCWFTETLFEFISCLQASDVVAQVSVPVIDDTVGLYLCICMYVHVQYTCTCTVSRVHNTYSTTVKYLYRTSTFCACKLNFNLHVHLMYVYMCMYM